MGTYKTWSATRLSLGPLFFITHINDFSSIISKIANPILFADDTSIIISHTNPEELKNNTNTVLNETINWFQSNFLTLNCNKTHFLQFLTKKHNRIKMQIISCNTIITNINTTRFLELIIYSSLSWKDHIIELTSKLNKACYAIWAIKPFMSLDAEKMIYYSFVQSLTSYGIIFWGNSHLTDSIFKVQKRIIRIITNAGKRDTCCQLYKQLQILPLPSLYIFLLLVLSIKIEACFCPILKFITETHIITTIYICLPQI